MIEQRQVVILCEDGEMREENVRYGIELASRLKASFFLLMLARTAEEQLKDSLQKTFEGVLKRARAAGLSAEGEFRHGDKASELLKSLASLSRPSAIVFGGDDTTPKSKGLKRSGHWLWKVAGQVGCPIVSPQRK